MIRITKWALSWLLSHATFKVTSSDTPEGNPLGGHDIPGIADKYIIILIEVGPAIILHGYWQAS